MNKYRQIECVGDDCVTTITFSRVPAFQGALIIRRNRAGQSLGSVRSVQSGFGQGQAKASAACGPFRPASATVVGYDLRPRCLVFGAWALYELRANVLRSPGQPIRRQVEPMSEALIMPREGPARR